MLDNKQFRTRLTLARETVAGLNMSELGRRLGISAQAVQAWEVGKNIPRPKRIEEIAQVLGVSAPWLAYGEGSMLLGSVPTAPAPASERDGLTRALVAPRTTTQDLRSVASAWEGALKDALPPTLRPYLDRQLPSPWPRIDYHSPHVAAEVVLSSHSPALPDRLYRHIIRLMIVERLAQVANQRLRLLLVLADLEGVGHPELSTRLSWEAQTLGIEIATVATAEQAAAAIQALEG